MKSIPTFFYILSCLALEGSSQLVPFLSKLRNPNPPELRPAQQSQAPFMNQPPNIALPGTDNSPSTSDPAPPNSGVLIFDVVGKSREINIFAGFTRDIAAIAARLESASANSTILAPLNAELYKLPRKPWEDAQDYARLGAQAYEGEGGTDRANANLKRFVEAHVVPESPWAEGRKVETLAGKLVWWEGREGGKKLIQPDGILVESIADKVANGEVWILKGVVNYAS